MAQVAFDEILNRFVKAKLDIELIEIDLSAEQRFTSNGQVVREAIDARASIASRTTCPLLVNRCSAERSISINSISSLAFTKRFNISSKATCAISSPWRITRGFLTAIFESKGVTSPSVAQSAVAVKFWMARVAQGGGQP